MTALSDRIVEHYEKHAADWAADRSASGWNDRRWHECFADALPKGAAILDLGCGAGEPIARYFVEHGFMVTGLDASATLISLCRDRMPDQDWIVGDMRGVSLGKTYEGILAWDSFFHLKPDDQRAMFAVFAAHVRPSSLLMFNSGPRFGEAIGVYRGDPLYHASLDPAEYRTLLERSGFEVIAHEVEDPTAGGRTVWMARSRS